MITSKKSSAFKIELLRIMFKPTENQMDFKVKIGDGFKEVYELARKGFSIFKGGEYATKK